MDLARMLNIGIPFTCGGKGKCGRCNVFVRVGMETLGSLTESEKNLLSPEEIRSGLRHGCAIWSPMAANLIIDIPEGLTEHLKIHTDGTTILIQPDQSVRRYDECVRYSAKPLAERRISEVKQKIEDLNKLDDVTFIINQIS